MSAPDALPDEAVERLGNETIGRLALALLEHGYRPATHPGILAALAPIVAALVREGAAAELEAEAAYDDAAPNEQYARYLFAQRLRERAANLRDDT